MKRKHKEIKHYNKILEFMIFTFNDFYKLTEDPRCEADIKIGSLHINCLLLKKMVFLNKILGKKIKAFQNLDETGAHKFYSEAKYVSYKTDNHNILTALLGGLVRRLENISNANHVSILKEKLGQTLTVAKIDAS
jgi:hypothetical protein